MDKALRRLRELRFERGARAVLATPPVRAMDDGVVLFSMIGTRVLLPYLIAAKSLHHQLQRGRFAILDDGTLSSADRAILDHHLDNPQIFLIHDVDTGQCPQGGCWERLLMLLELRHNDYVVQLDSDTVTLGPVPEVIAAIAAGRNFSLRGEKDSPWLPVAKVGYDYEKLAPDAHVQAKIEALLGRIENKMPRLTHYARACAGFTGFAKGGFDRSIADDFSTQAAALVGPSTWAEWGSEQVMSNVIICNEGEPVLLPYDRYLNFWNAPLGGGETFVHFVGTYRFHGGAYAAAARTAIASLTEPLARQPSASAQGQSVP